VFAQSRETFDPDRDGHWYPLRPVERTFAGTGWLPEPWRAYSAQAGPRAASNCGIVGGTDSDLLREFADLGIRTVEAPENAAGWATWGNKGFCNVLAEQFLLNAVAESRGVPVAYLFPSDAAAYDPREAEAAGYTHLIGGAKRNPELMADLEARMWADHPDLAARCAAIANEPEA